MQLTQKLVEFRAKTTATRYRILAIPGAKGSMTGCPKLTVIGKICRAVIVAGALAMNLR